MIELVVFDWDGTLMDSEARIIHAMTTAFEREGLERPPSAAVRDIIGLDLNESVARIDPGLAPVVVEAVANTYRAEFRAAAAIESPLFADAAQTLETLASAGITLAVATGKSRAGLDRVLRETNLGRWFTTSRCGEECAPKPEPAMLLDILDETGADRGRTVMVGDTAFDIEMAAAAGVHAAAVTYGAHRKARLLDLHPAIVIDALRDLPAALTDLAQR